MIYVVGLGPGNISYLTEEGQQVIATSGVLIGGKRNLDSFPDFEGEKLELGSNLLEITTYIRKHKEKKKICVLASGDPLIYGIGKYILGEFEKEELVIVPGISAIQYFFSKIPLDMNDLYMTSSHGKQPNFNRILAMEKVAMVTDKVIGPSEIAEEIIKRKLNKVLWIGENLSYGNEKITKAKPEEAIGRKFQMNVVVIVDEK